MIARPSAKRRGAIAPLTAVLMIPLIAMLAFSIDLGWISHTHNELQAAADAASLAGAGQLADDWVRYHLPGQSAQQKASILAAATARARTYAKTFAGFNGAGGVASLTLSDNDIEFGFTDRSGAYTALPAYAGYPNTVKVLLRRGQLANTPLKLFFAPVLGTSSVELTGTASACVYSGTIDTFRTDRERLRILPMTYDVNHWNNFLRTGQGPDGETDHTDRGEPQLSIYSSLKERGNFGELSLDQGNDGASVINDWITTGISPADWQVNLDRGLVPLSAHNANNPPDWKGNPGLKATTIHEVAENIGELYLLPLFKPYNDGTTPGSEYAAGQGSGSNYYYTIVEFVGVKITEVSDKQVLVQPASYLDPNAVFANVAPATPPSGTNPLTTTFVGAKLVR
jgi:hypothetical protein